MARKAERKSSETVILHNRHLLIGWVGLVLFMGLGGVLETLHGLKVDFYLDVRNETRRLMWRLAHSHGALFSLVHIALAVSLSSLRLSSAKGLAMVSACFSGGLIAMPLGFFLGGLWLYGGDPGIGVFLAPVGALLMLVGVVAFIRVLLRARREAKS